jgi:hypothetical protein
MNNLTIQAKHKKKYIKMKEESKTIRRRARKKCFCYICQRLITKGQVYIKEETGLKHHANSEECILIDYL